MKMKWKSVLALFALVSGFLSAAVLPVPAGAATGTTLAIFEVAALPGMAFGIAVCLFLYFFEKIRLSFRAVSLWILASVASSLSAYSFTLISSNDGSPLLFFPAAIYLLSGAIAAFFIAIGFLVFLALNKQQFFSLLVLGGVLSFVGVSLVQYLNVNPVSHLPNFLFFEIWQVGMAFMLESILNHRSAP